MNYNLPIERIKVSKFGLWCRWLYWRTVDGSYHANNPQSMCHMKWKEVKQRASSRKGLLVTWDHPLAGPYSKVRYKL